MISTHTRTPATPPAGVPTAGAARTLASCCPGPLTGAPMPGRVGAGTFFHTIEAGLGLVLFFLLGLGLLDGVLLALWEAVTGPGGAR